ncbi:MAG: secretin N-terminal domain-containing protein [Pyrinomonadaceae bacterium]
MRLPKYFTIAACLLIFTVAASAQTPAPAPADNYVTEKGFKSRVFQVKSRDADSLSRVLRALGSGFKGASITSNAEFRTLTVRDFPENIAAIEEALTRLDTPAAPRPNIELHVHVLLASRTGETGAAQIPAELKDVLTQLRDTFNYKSFEIATSVNQRLTETDRGLNNGGSARITKTTATGAPDFHLLNYTYSIGGVSLTNTPGSTASSIQMNEFSFSATVPNTNLGARVSTALNLRDGEKVVVGTAAFEDRALIVVLTARLIK